MRNTRYEMTVTDAWKAYHRALLWSPIPANTASTRLPRCSSRSPLVARQAVGLIETDVELRGSRTRPLPRTGETGRPPRGWPETKPSGRPVPPLPVMSRMQGRRAGMNAGAPHGLILIRGESVGPMGSGPALEPLGQHPRRGRPLDAVAARGERPRGAGRLRCPCRRPGCGAPSNGAAHS